MVWVINMIDCFLYFLFFTSLHFTFLSACQIIMPTYLYGVQPCPTASVCSMQRNLQRPMTEEEKEGFYSFFLITFVVVTRKDLTSPCKFFCSFYICICISN